MHIEFNEAVIERILNNEKALRDAVLLLEAMMDEELEKDEAEIDFDFINDCVAVLIELQSGDGADREIIVPFFKSGGFTVRAGKKRHLGKAAKVLLVAAAVITSTLTANAAVGGITGESLVERVVQSLSVSAEDVPQEVTTSPTYSVDRMPQGTQEEPATVKQAEEIPSDVITVTERQYDSRATFTKPAKKESTTKDEKTTESEKTTVKEETETQETETTAAPVIFKLQVVIAQGTFKRTYQLGEAFDSKGLYVIGYYSDGTSRTLTEKDYSLSGFDSETPGVKTLRIGADNGVYILTVTVLEPETETTTAEENEPVSE